MGNHVGKFELKSTPLVDGLPITIGAFTLRDAGFEAITSISPFQGKESAVKKALGAWVDVGESADTKYGRLTWSGLDQAFLFGCVDIADAACVDISDGWVFLALEGKDAYRVLERLAPIDLRRAKEGTVFRTQLAHLMAMITRTNAGFEIGVMSSFVESAKHEIESVMEGINEK